MVEVVATEPDSDGIGGADHRNVPKRLVQVGGERTVDVVLVDVEHSEHGTLMVEATRLGGWRPKVTWLPPDLDLAARLTQLGSTPSIVAVPVGVAGGHPHDRFTQAVMSAIRDLRDLGLPVFVAAGNIEHNVLSTAGTAVAPFGDRRGVLQVGAASFGSSGACVRAASIASFMSGRRVAWRSSGWRTQFIR